MEKSKANQRKILLINPSFQLKYIFITASWTAVLSSFFPLVIWTLFESFFRYISKDPNGLPIQELQNYRNQVLWLLVIVQVLYVTIVSLWGLFLSHRIAGPLYKLKKGISEIAETGEIKEIYFRKYDHFQDLASTYNSWMISLKEKDARIHQAKKALQSGDSKSALDLLNSIKLSPQKNQS